MSRRTGLWTWGVGCGEGIRGATESKWRNLLNPTQIWKGNIGFFCFVLKTCVDNLKVEKYVLLGGLAGDFKPGRQPL